MNEQAWIEHRDQPAYPSWPAPVRELECPICDFYLQLPGQYATDHLKKPGAHGSEHRGNLSHARAQMRRHVSSAHPDFYNNIGGEAR